MDNLHVVNGHPKLVGDDLGESSLLTLAVGRGAHEYVDLARGVEADDGALPEAAAESNRTGNLGRPDAAYLAVCGHADANQLFRSRWLVVVSMLMVMSVVVPVIVAMIMVVVPVARHLASGLGLLAPQFVVAHVLQHLVQRPLVVAAVIG